jgi:hypothetical protein
LQEGVDYFVRAFGSDLARHLSETDEVDKENTDLAYIAFHDMGVTPCAEFGALMASRDAYETEERARNSDQRRSAYKTMIVRGLAHLKTYTRRSLLRIHLSPRRVGIRIVPCRFGSHRSFREASIIPSLRRGPGLLPGFFKELIAAGVVVVKFVVLLAFQIILLMVLLGRIKHGRGHDLSDDRAVESLVML